MVNQQKKAAISALALLLSLTGCAAAPRLRNVSVLADVSTQIGGDVHYGWAGTDYHGGHVGRLGIALDQPVTREFGYRLSIEHTSLLDTSRDRGEERASFGIVFRPFAGGSR